jgi:hypothetical protein
MENNLKKIKVVILPAEKANILTRGQLWTPNDNDVNYTTLRIWDSADAKVEPEELKGYCIPQHLYLVSDTEPQVDDWIILIDRVEKVLSISKEGSDEPRIKHTSSNEKRGFAFSYHNHCKKIEATTDKSITYAVPQNVLGDKFNDYYPIPQIPKSFIEVYAKANGDIKEVNIEMEKSFHGYFNEGGEDWRFKIKTRDDGTVIIHLKEEESSITLTMDEYTERMKAALFKGKSIAVADMISEFDDEKWIKETLKK